MADSFITYTGDGSTTIFSIPFGYLTTDHLTATVDGVTTAVTFPTSGQFEFSTAPGNATAVTLTRNTPRNTREVVWQDAANLSAGDLNTSDLQLLYVTQEAFDAATNNISLVSDDTFDALNKRIKNLSTPVNPTDAATKAYADSTLSLTNADVASAEAAKDAAELAQTGAETAESSSQAVLAQMQILYDDWDDRYLGSKATDPALDNDGDALEDGALYFNTTANQLRVYDIGSTSWLVFDAIIPDNTITLAKMSNDSVSEDEIVDGSVTFNKCAGSLHSTTVQAEAGTNTSSFMSPLRTKQAIKALSPFVAEYMHLQHRAPNASNGGNGGVISNFTPDTGERIRPITDELQNTISGASTTTGVNGFVTLPAGTYRLSSIQQHYDTQYVQSRLRDADDGTLFLLGLSSFSRNAGGEQEPTFTPMKGLFVLTAETDVQFTFVRDTGGTSETGLGSGVNGSYENVYADIEIWKLD